MQNLHSCWFLKIFIQISPGLFQNEDAAWFSVCRRPGGNVAVYLLWPCEMKIHYVTCRIHYWLYDMYKLTAECILSIKASFDCSYYIFSVTLLTVQGIEKYVGETIGHQTQSFSFVSVSDVFEKNSLALTLLNIQFKPHGLMKSNHLALLGMGFSTT